MQGMGVYAGSLIQGSQVFITDLGMRQPFFPTDAADKAQFCQGARKTKVQ